MIFRIKLADRIIEINSLYSKVYNICSDYLVDDSVEMDTSIYIDISSDDIERENHITRMEQQKDSSMIQIDYFPQHLETIALHRLIVEKLIDYNTILMHGSVISTDGIGYMITAPSGVGKSTRTKIWKSVIDNSVVVNGDKPLIRIDEDAVYAYGSPWSGKEGWNTNTKVPLRAIFLLERADDSDRSSVEEIDFNEAFPFLYHQTYKTLNNEQLRRTIHLLKLLKGKVKTYRFRSKPTADAVEMAYNYAKPDY